MADPSSNPSNVNTNMPNTSTATRQKRNSSDVGWEYGETVDENNLDRVRCKKCGHTFGGGIYRLKQHVGQIVGNVKIYPNPTPEAKRICREALANTKKRDIVRPGITRFASSFLSLQSLFEKKEQLRLMATSQEWIDCVHSKTVKRKATSNTMLSVSFWRGVTMCLGIFTPLVRVLRVVDGDRPSMPWLHGEFEAAKKVLERVFKGEEKYYKPVLDIIDDKCNGRLNGDLHLVAFILNPYYLYRFSDREEFAGQEKYVEAMLTCVSKFFPDEEEVQTKVLEVELLKYKNKEGLFGKKAAENSLEFNDFHTFNPVGWWSTYGAGTPNL